MTKELPLIKQCMYCRMTEYTTEKTISISHGIDGSFLCRLEAMLDMTEPNETEQEFNQELQRMCYYGDDNDS